MPLYTYKCKKCGAETSNIMSVADMEYQEQYGGVCCPNCGTKMIKEFCSSFILKGDGWAKDNYQKGGNSG